MTNFEKYQDKIKEIIDKRDNVALVNGEPIECDSLETCKNCGFHNPGRSCMWRLIKWACEEYKEPKINLPDDIKVDTPILVSDTGEYWHRRYFAKNEKDCVYTWDNGGTSWSSYNMVMAMSAWNYAKLAEAEE